MHGRAPQGFRREMTVLDVAAITVGCVVGSGIFVVPALIAKVLPSPYASLSVWMASGCLCVVGALVMSELAGRFPTAGGLYTFLAEAYGDAVGFLYGWTAAVVVGPAVAAALATALASSIGPWLTPTVPLRALAIALIAVCALVNVLGLGATRWIQRGSTVVKIAGLLAIVTIALSQRSPLEASAATLETRVFSWHGVIAAFAMTIWTFDGWTFVGFCGAETRRAERTLPVGWILGLLVVGVLYAAVNLAYYSVLSPRETAAADNLAVATLEALSGPGPASAMFLLIVISLLGSLHAVLLTSSRCVVAMALDGLLPSRWAVLHPRHRTPVMAILLQAAVGSCLIFAGGFGELISISLVANWLFYAAAAMGLAILRHRLPAASAFPIPAYPWSVLVFCAGCGAVVVATVLVTPWQAALSVFLVLTGWLAYSLCVRSGRPLPPRAT
jgi:basic amino acid/polyamine antiporter, APA family